MRTNTTFHNSALRSKHIPCLHRIHDDTPDEGAHWIQNQLGMSISFQSLEAKLKALSTGAFELNSKPCHQKKEIVTFDDGHRDLLKSIHIFQNFTNLQPIVFVTGNLLRGDNRPLPLTAFYSWCSNNDIHPNESKAELGFDREALKQMPEEDQRSKLSSVGVDLEPVGEEMLSLSELTFLSKKGWLIGYHGPNHCDLRIYSQSELKPMLVKDHELLKELGFMACLAWPEGRWNDELYQVAKETGFDSQFGLMNEKGKGTSPQVLDRVIWK